MEQVHEVNEKNEITTLKIDVSVSENFLGKRLVFTESSSSTAPLNKSKIYSC